MRILYLSTPSFADCDFPLVKALQEEGHEVTYLILLAPFCLKSTLFDIKEQIREDGILPATRYPELRVYENYMDLNHVFIANRTSPRDSSLQSLRMTLKVAQFIRRGRFDVIHTDSMLGMWNLLLYRWFGHRMVMTVHDPFPHSGEVSARKAFVYKVVMASVSRFVLLNHEQLDAFCKTYHIRPERVLINRLGVYDNIRTFVAHGQEANRHDVLFFGRISPYKGIEYLCQAMAKVREVVADATLTIAGGGKMYFDISPYEGREWVTVINRYVGMEELAGLLAQCSMTVCPYTDATQSGVIMTSYSLCKPVVATRVGGLAEMVEDGKTGLLVPPRDVDALANAILSLLNDDAKLETMAKNIQSDYFTGDKSWKTIAKKYLEFYKKIQ